MNLDKYGCIHKTLNDSLEFVSSEGINNSNNT